MQESVASSGEVGDCARLNILLLTVGFKARRRTCGGMKKMRGAL